jgi:hypothetical protein
MRGTGKKKCESCGTPLVEDEFDICQKCMSKATPFVDDVDNETDEDLGGSVNDQYFDDEYDY